MVAVIAAGVLLVLVALGYLLFRGQAAGPGHAADRRLESDERAARSGDPGAGRAGSAERLPGQRPAAGPAADAVVRRQDPPDDERPGVSGCWPLELGAGWPDGGPPPSRRCRSGLWVRAERVQLRCNRSGDRLRDRVGSGSGNGQAVRRRHQPQREGQRWWTSSSRRRLDLASSAGRRRGRTGESALH